MAYDLFEKASKEALDHAARNPVQGDELTHLDWPVVFGTLGLVLCGAWLIYAFILSDTSGLGPPSHDPKNRP